MFDEAHLHFPMGRPPEGTEAWWRVEWKSYSSCVDPERGYYTTSSQLEAWFYQVAKTTPKGVWLNLGFTIDWGTQPKEERIKLRNGDYRFVLLDARKQFACPTIHEALESFIARKNRHLDVLEAQHRSATAGRQMAAKYLELEYMRKVKERHVYVSE